MCSINWLKDKINKSITEEEFRNLLKELRIRAADEKSQELSIIIDYALNKAKSLKHLQITILLMDLKIRQLYHTIENISKIESLLYEMRQLSSELSFPNGLCLSYQLEWHVEKLKGNKKKSQEAIALAIKIINDNEAIDEYTYYGCNYSYALELWIEERRIESAHIFEECVQYFYKNEFYHGLASSLGILIVIYQQTQNKEKSMKLIRNILRRENLLLQMPEEIQSIIHFFIGFSHELSFNLNEAEKHLIETRRILKPLYRKSMYSSYYLTALSYLASTYALQGKLELALKQMNEVEKLIEEGIVTKNLDTFSKDQIKHIFNQTKFYIHSRLQNFQIENQQELVQIIFNSINNYQSNAMFFSEFLLHANLAKEQLIKLKNLNNPSTKRVEHIINFLIEKTTSSDEKRIMNRISALKRRPVEERMTFTEKAFADLLAAQDYYKIHRFAEISPLLKKYENNLHKIEVLEMRIFMEAFIQVGAYKNGDPLGPALQYMAIKKCRQQGFSMLESKLLDYLNMQGNDVHKMMLSNR